MNHFSFNSTNKRFMCSTNKGQITTCILYVPYFFSHLPMMPLLQNPVELKSRKNVLKNKFLNVESYFAFYLYYMIYVVLDK